MDENQRLLDVFESVLGVDPSELTDEDGPGTISDWDSVNHLNLILAIEAEFEVQFATSEIPELISVGKIKSRLGGG